ncbi:NF038129 family PEP-CTERM protein [Iodobacter sp. CM08]|uniref:NF038129 family PEP-CTERM protein n=1 Tax=Iodobacter sp. CM08 TaxID=3085902 RepID=UPI0029813134|nr:NF038129 family PEP-CTERM protein [Iodobacter sp. CM08]MDW5417349.1 NF038129 family PEP-CTERM protein [Iodobacter sp. CM08]
MKHILKLALAGLALVCSNMASAAMYQVDVDTRALEGQGGFVALGLNGLSDSPLVRALVSQFRGSSFGLVDNSNTFNVLGQLSSTLKLDNLQPNQFTQGVIFGKKLQFNVEFAESNSVIGSGTSFAFSLLDKNYGSLLSADPSGVAVMAEFTPGSATSFNSLLRADGKAVATITPVPEPETYALIGLGLLGLAMQRRKRSSYISKI